MCMFCRSMMLFVKEKRSRFVSSQLRLCKNKQKALKFGKKNKKYWSQQKGQPSSRQLAPALVHLTAVLKEMWPDSR